MLSEFEMTEIITNLAGAYPNYTPKMGIPELIRLYWSGLNDLPPSSVRRAAFRIIRESEFFPSIAAMRKAAKAEIEVLGSNHKHWIGDDHSQRMMDEMYDLAPRLLTADKIEPGQRSEFNRLMNLIGDGK